MGFLVSSPYKLSYEKKAGNYKVQITTIIKAKEEIIICLRMFFHFSLGEDFRTVLNFFLSIDGYFVLQGLHIRRPFFDAGNPASYQL